MEFAKKKEKQRKKAYPCGFFSEWLGPMVFGCIIWYSVKERPSYSTLVTFTQAYKSRWNLASCARVGGWTLKSPYCFLGPKYYAIISPVLYSYNSVLKFGVFFIRSRSARLAYNCQKFCRSNVLHNYLPWWTRARDEHSELSTLREM